ncbi:MAG: zinc-dependent alcohol dehydrogenase family protein [Candidatus Cloacimonetes bacterium]|nr:zinc-dependent alcohol dehydrogenase family protein [Candidatus Cloacimonadota bacterium]MCF7813306.1 zinc-dependent alcohol dehydrogenase family protein [Candidatus Cloacimonadota bacterium]MCF7867381.1 zinc-dependent alcohol dehydrogenase family protein [Candidatus Cloacimonadota bacterium]MCF7882815.1 zinc-dependent alcohol dehydrogenase family protein [Candidatus Cloacimonadota bacterium]
MKAQTLTKIHDLTKESNSVILSEIPTPKPEENEILIKVSVCGVCHTELDEIEGRTPPHKFPLVLGHEVVGKVVEIGIEVNKHKIGDRVGAGWIWSACGKCEFCLRGDENLCVDFKATGRDVNGGYAEYMTVPEKYAYKIPDIFSDSEAAPLLCAGGVGYRSLKLANLKDGDVLGLTGFGASGHLVLEMAKHKYPKSRFFIFARNPKERKFAIELGADWAGNTTEITPELCNAIIDTTPVWKPVIAALNVLKPGGRLVINAIRKENSDIDEWKKIKYEEHLWQEKEIKSVANVTAEDIEECLQLAAKIPIKPEIKEYKLEDANKALMELKQGNIRGAKVLNINL